MALILGLCVLLYALAALLRLPPALRWALPLGLYAVTLLIHVTLPEGHALRAATGGSAVPWLFLGATAAVVLIYREGLRRLRAKVAAKDAATAAEAPAQGPFSASELDRYSRHIILRDIGGTGQRRLKDARVLVIGAGGLGAPALLYLAAAGVGRIGVIDNDVVEGTNLQRQVIHRDADIGTPKALSAARAMEALNPFIEVRPYNRALTEEIAADLFADYDLILDGTDNFATRYLANRVAVAQGKPLVSGALSQWEGQVSTYDPAKGAPCYQCIVPQEPPAELAPACAIAGVLGPLPGVVGSMMAVETVKLITRAGQDLRGRMMIYDALWNETRQITLKPRPHCPVCGTGGLAKHTTSH